MPRWGAGSVRSSACLRPAHRAPGLTSTTCALRLDGHAREYCFEHLVVDAHVVHSHVAHSVETLRLSRFGGVLESQLSGRIVAFDTSYRARLACQAMLLLQILSIIALATCFAPIASPNTVRYGRQGTHVRDSLFSPRSCQSPPLARFPCGTCCTCKKYSATLSNFQQSDNQHGVSSAHFGHPSCPLISLQYLSP